MALQQAHEGGHFKSFEKPRCSRRPTGLRAKFDEGEIGDFWVGPQFSRYTMAKLMSRIYYFVSRTKKTVSCLHPPARARTPASLTVLGSSFWTRSLGPNDFNFSPSSSPSRPKATTGTLCSSFADLLLQARCAFNNWTGLPQVLDGLQSSTPRAQRSIDTTHVIRSPKRPIDSPPAAFCARR